MPLLAVLGNKGRKSRKVRKYRRNSMLPMIAGGVAAGVAGAVANKLLKNPWVPGNPRSRKNAPNADDLLFNIDQFLKVRDSGDAVDYLVEELYQLLQRGGRAPNWKAYPLGTSYFRTRLVGAKRLRGGVARKARKNPWVPGNPRATNNRGGRWYVGLKHDSRREVFRSALKPTAKSHGSRFGAVVGPYKSKAEALSKFALMNPKSKKNPCCSRNPGTNQNVISLPFRQGKKYTVDSVKRWVAAHGTPEMKARFDAALKQYTRFHKGSPPKFITYDVQKIGAHKGIVDVEFGISEGHEWMAAYQVPKSSGKWADKASAGRYVHAHGDSDIEVDVKRPVKMSKLPRRFHTADGKFVGVIPSKNVKIGEWYEG